MAMEAAIETKPPAKQRLLSNLSVLDGMTFPLLSSNNRQMPSFRAWMDLFQTENDPMPNRLQNSNPSPQKQ